MKNITKSRAYSYWMMGFLGIFFLRICAQLVQAIYPITFIPDFYSWQSGAVPYPILLALQLVVVVFCVHMIKKFYTSSVQENKTTGLIYLLIGGIYFFIMIFRLLAGLSFAADHPWLGAHIPTLFHIVLSFFVLAVGFFHTSHTDKIVAWFSYPMIMLSGIISYYICLGNDVSLYFASYCPILFGAALIMILEMKFPHRQEWLADRDIVFNDSAYMLLVQTLLPKFLVFFVAIQALGIIQEQDAAIANIWPHDWPIYIQTLLMMLLAEFMRYWLHRLAHEWLPLWKFHAVHHSPHKLYWLNVGRFHPIEKSMQFLFDTLPFIIMGVSEEVLALYFVFYAINGFFQHCNIELRLGFLNYLISGPELHRWHHSKRIKESNNNYGNNLIVWDLLFGTWFLPKNRLVGDIGLLNREYPMDFMRQMKAPFIQGMDKAQ